MLKHLTQLLGKETVEALSATYSERTLSIVERVAPDTAQEAEELLRATHNVEAGGLTHAVYVARKGLEGVPMIMCTTCRDAFVQFPFISQATWQRLLASFEARHPCQQVVDRGVVP